MLRSRSPLWIAVGLAWSLSALAMDETVVTGDGSSAVAGVTVESLAERPGGSISGVVVNKTDQLVRDVRILIQKDWRWKDELHPGSDDPGWSAYYSLSKEVEPGESVGFTFEPPKPSPERSDGTYALRASVAGFTRVVRQKQEIPSPAGG